MVGAEMAPVIRLAPGIHAQSGDHKPEIALPGSGLDFPLSDCSRPCGMQ